MATVTFKILQVPSKNETLSCCLRLQGVVLTDPLANRVPSNLYALVNGSFLVEWKAKSTDINGDGKVNIQDVTIVAVAYGSKPGDPKWNVAADLDDSGKIDIVDVVTVAKDYGKTV